MGTPAFAVPSLRSLDSLATVVGVFTRPDAVSGRGRHARSSAVAQYALERGLELFQPRSLRDDEARRSLSHLAPDLIVVAAYGLILPAEVLAVPASGAVNVHASLLPRWRGAAPVQRAILAGDEVTGVCLMRMEEGLDTGPYCACARTAVADKGAQELTSELALLGAGLVESRLTELLDGSCEWIAQDPESVTYAEKVTRSDVSLTPGLTAADAARRVRASGHSAPCRIRLGGRTLTVVSASVSAVRIPAGSAAVRDGAVLLGLSDGSLALGRVKPDGKQEMSADAWARGLRETPGSWDAA